MALVWHPSPQVRSRMVKKEVRVRFNQTLIGMYGVISTDVFVRSVIECVCW